MPTVEAAREKQQIGLPVTDFSLPLVDGGGMRALRDYLESKRGAVVVFWSSVCSHCVRYDDYFNRFTRHHPELSLVGVAPRHGETAEAIGEAMAQRALTFPILHDSGGKVARQWYTQQTPRVFLVDAAGTLLYRGAVDNFKFPEDSEYQAYLEPAIASFLSGQPIERN